ERVDYKPDDVVIDNPPFSLFSRIIDFYLDRGVKFWLWGPSLTLFTGAAVRATCVVCGETLTYANGAGVATSFCSNLYPPDVAVVVDGQLNRLMAEGDKRARKATVFTTPVYDYPAGVISAARLHKIASAGLNLTIMRSEALGDIDSLQSQRPAGKAIFGKGMLIAREAAAREAAAREAAARERHYWPLSEQEIAVIDSLTTPAEIYQIPKYVPDPLNAMVANPPFAAPTIKPEHPSLFDELTEEPK
ncbi:MAG: hypothetical protein LIO91_08180, partial [Bacteroidales bacterium]|nr:hypothetical protein [Bacteroidales bacterium]